MIPVKCPSCQKSYKPVTEEFAGRKVTCQQCKTTFVITGPKPAAQAPAPPKPAGPPPLPKPAAQVKPPPPPPPKPAAAAAKPPVGPPPLPPGAIRPAAAQAKPPAAKAVTGQVPKPPAPGKPAVPVAKPAPGKPPVAPPGDLEDEAAAALADTPPANHAAAPTATTIDFRCPQCDEEVKMPIAMAGKNAPCPECRRIVRVPMPTAKQPTDWRKVNTGGPALAKGANEIKLDGVWSSSSAEKVTGGELVRAGVIEEKREPWTRGQKIRAWLVLLVVCGLGYGGFVAARTYWAHSQEEKALRKALAAAENKEAPLAPLAAAEIHRAAGEFYARAGNVDSAREQFHKARGRLEDKALAGASDRDTLLFDIALGQVSLVLGPEEIKKAKHRKLAEKQQEDVMGDVKATLQRIEASEVRLDAVRQIARTLLARKQGQRAPELAAPMVCGDDQAEALARIGLEYVRAGLTQEAGTLADLALGTMKTLPAPLAKDKAKSQAAVVSAPSLVALCLLLNRPREKWAQAAAEGSLSWYLGNAEAAARQNKLDAARGFTKGLQPLDEWRGLAALAATGLEQEPPVLVDAEQVAKLDAATLEQLAEADGKRSKGSAKADVSWLLLRLVRLAVRTGPGQDELAKRLAEDVPDPALRARARFEALRGRLQRGHAPAPDDWAKDVDAQTSAYPLAREAQARHNARHAGGSSTLKAVDAWTPETLRPFGYVGAALGIQDAQR